MVAFKFIETLLLLFSLSVVFALTTDDGSDPVDVLKVVAGADGEEKVEVNTLKYLGRMSEDHRFLQELVEEAETKVVSDRMKTFLDRLSRDNRFVIRRLHKIAEKKDMEILRIQMRGNRDVRKDRLQDWWKEYLAKLEGRRFEEAFLIRLVRWNRTAVLGYMGMANHIEDKEIREFVDEVAPLFRQHLLLATVVRREGLYVH